MRLGCWHPNRWRDYLNLAILNLPARQSDSIINACSKSFLREEIALSFAHMEFIELLPARIARIRHQDRAMVRQIGGALPVLAMFRQMGREEDGWRGVPFWWPALFAPTTAAPSIFASTIRDNENLEEDAAENED